ncbi:CocE/NonD family hydrolase [Streptomyces sp. NPDC018833]|uniref:CocE/NonD family hydrolase n=1 Tax=Streptomyces sp. NPDC018833 TaxID=3365053 RepID=UPI00379627C7
MRIRTDFPFETAHEDVRVRLPDGIALYARMWRPVTDEPVPALLEYAADRLSDATVVRDGERHPWYAGHGYASVRVDVRGHGNSEGAPGGESDAAELADGVAVVEWLAGQPWCTGRVGMIGIGPAGRTALQIAALAPPPLRAVVAVCASDDPYETDGPFLGGSLTCRSLHSRSAARLAQAARPPDPLHTGDAWRTMWLRRLEAIRPAVPDWSEHPLRDVYWRSAGIRDDTDAVRAAVLAVSGLHDPARDTVLRLVEQLPADRVRGLLGPWPRQYPDRDPERGIGFLQETLRWWDQWLRDRDTGVLAEPLLRCRLGPSAPGPGRWTGDDVWPSPHVTVVPHTPAGDPVPVRSPQHTGTDAGGPCPVGHPADLPPDQREEDARSVCFDFPVGGTPVVVLGRPRVTLWLRLEAPHGHVVARLCDIAPDGASTLVTRGALDLAAPAGRRRALAWRPGTAEDVSFDLSLAGHTFAPGHRIRLAVSSAYWPWLWPDPEAAGFTLDPAGSRLDLPVREPTGVSGVFAEPEHSEPAAVAVPQTLDGDPPRLLLTRDVTAGLWTLDATPHSGGTHVHPDGLEHTEEAHETYAIQQDDPLSALAETTWWIRLHRPELGWDVRIEARSAAACDVTGFTATDELVCRDGDEIVFHRTWEKHVPRPAR